MEIKENVAQKNVKCSGKYIYYKKRFDQKFGLNLFLLKKEICREMILISLITSLSEKKVPNVRKRD